MNFTDRIRIRKRKRQCASLTDDAVMAFCSERGIAATTSIHDRMYHIVHSMIECEGLEKTKKEVAAGSILP